MSNGRLRRLAAAVFLVLLAAGCQGVSGDADVSYCDAVATLQQRWGYQRTLEGNPDSFDQLEQAVQRVEEQNAVVAETAPEEVRDEWEAIGGQGDAGDEAIDTVLDHADEDCGSDLRGIFDGLSPDELERYATPPADA